MDKNKRRRIYVLVKRLSSLTHIIEKYQKTPHSYGTEDKFLMNEVHFLSAVDDEGTEMGVIAERMFVTPGAVSQAALKLEKKGYISRERDPKDGRKNICRLKDSARAIKEYHDRVDKRNMDALYDFMGDFSTEDLKMCERFLEAMEKLYSMSIDLEE